MDSHVILDAIGMINDQHIISAQKRFGCQLPQSASAPRESSGRHIHGRAFISIAAAMLFIISSFVTAMAVNEDFREKVFEFFRISATEDVPDGNSMNPDRAELEGKVFAEYLNVEKELTLIGNGTMYDAEYDENGNVRNIFFYQIVGGSLQTIPTKITEFQLIAGSTPVNGEFYWCSVDGGISVVGNGKTADQSRTWDVSAIDQRSDVVLLSVFGGIADNLDFHAFLLNLHTGNVDPVFSDTGLCKLTHVQDIQITSDCKYALVLGKAENELEATPHLYNLHSGQLISLQEKIDESFDVSAFFADDDTVLLTGKNNNRYYCWSYAISEDSIQKTVDQGNDAENGEIIDLGSQYVICVYEDNTAVAIDQKTGLYSSIIDGFTYDNRAEVLASKSGRKACYYVSEKTDDSLSVKTLGIIDFDTAQFTLFNRTGFEKNQEWRLGWIDENRIGISVAGSQSNLYIYEFQ